VAGPLVPDDPQHQASQHEGLFIFCGQRSFGTVGANHLGDYVRKEVSDEADVFVNAFLAANPKR